MIADYWLHEHPSTDTRTRSNVIADYTGLLDAFLRGKIYDIFCRNTTVSPDDILAGKIVVVALPVAAYHEVGRYAAAIWKYLLQRASQRRKLDHPETIRPSFIWADEAQYFSSPTDQIFQTVARSYRIGTVFLTQNLPNYYVEFGGTRPEFTGSIRSWAIWPSNSSAETTTRSPTNGRRRPSIKVCNIGFHSMAPRPGRGTQLVCLRVRNSIARVGISSGLGMERRSMTTSSKRSHSRAAGDGPMAGAG